MQPVAVARRKRAVEYLQALCLGKGTKRKDGFGQLENSRSSPDHLPHQPSRPLSLTLSSLLSLSLSFLSLIFLPTPYLFLSPSVPEPGGAGGEGGACARGKGQLGGGEGALIFLSAGSL